jgi:hypothetical protein
MGHLVTVRIAAAGGQLGVRALGGQRGPQRFRILAENPANGCLNHLYCLKLFSPLFWDLKCPIAHTVLDKKTDCLHTTYICIIVQCDQLALEKIAKFLDKLSGSS